MSLNETSHSFLQFYIVSYMLMQTFFSLYYFVDAFRLKEGKEMFYLTMCATHFIDGYMALNIW